MRWFVLVFLTLNSCLKEKNDNSYNWLEKVDSKVALRWVSRESKKTLDEMSKDETFKEQKHRILKRLESKDKLLRVSQKGDYIYNLWKDENHPRGLWRRASYSLFTKAKSYTWENLLDIDLLSKQENKKWVFKGATFIPGLKDHVV